MTTDIDTIAAELESAKADLAQWERLTSAADRVKALTASFDKARIAQVKAEEAAAKEAAEARFKGLSNLRVIPKLRRGHDEGGALSYTYRIIYTGSAYNADTGRSEPGDVTIHGFDALDERLFAYLIERHPEQIPAEIAALSPDDPYEAFNRYFVARKRGYTIGDAV